MKFKHICELKKGEKVEGFYLLKDINVKLTNGSNNKFLDMTFIDKTGDINAKLWEYKNGYDELFKEHKIVFAKANVIEWKGKLQLKIDTMRLAEDSDDINIEDFVPTAPYDSKDMFEDVLRFKDKIKNEDIQNIVTAVLEEAGPDILYFPAAKSNHHAVRGGLLYHTTTMLKGAEKLSEIYSFLNQDLLYAGIILHDISKMEEMIANSLGIVSEYSVEGQLLGHITMGVRRIERIAKELNVDKEISMLLQHMILAHHYYPEYGSPKKPMIPEAELLHHLDMIDSRMYDMNKALNETNVGCFSDRICSLDNISIYKSKFGRE